MFLYCSIPVPKSCNLNINVFVLYVHNVKAKTDGPLCFGIFFLKGVQKFFYHWVKPATKDSFQQHYNGFTWMGNGIVTGFKFYQYF